MSKKEILNKAIEKAIAGGWAQHPFSICDGVGCLLHDSKTVWTPGEDNLMTLDNPASFIFNHHFAKALWGGEFQSFKFISPEREKPFYLFFHAYEGHLMQMVKAKDPIEYLGANLPD